MTLSHEVATALAQPFPLDDLEWRMGAKMGDQALMLPYITARAVFDRLDQVLGLGRWMTEHRPSGRTDGGWICRLSLYVNIGSAEDPNYMWVYHEDGADQTQIEPTKGGCSDSLKRVAVRFGIGRYLYSLPRQWAPLDRSGKPDRGWRPGPLPPWATPDGSAVASPAAAPQRARGEAPRTAPQRNEGRDTGEDPTVPLPQGGPPFDISAPVGFGKYRNDSWAFMAQGAPGGRRRGWLEWAEENIDQGKQSWAKVHALLDWLRANEDADDASGSEEAEHYGPPELDGDVPF